MRQLSLVPRRPCSRSCCAAATTHASAQQRRSARRLGGLLSSSVRGCARSRRLASQPVRIVTSQSSSAQQAAAAAACARSRGGRACMLPRCAGARAGGGAATARADVRVSRSTARAGSRAVSARRVPCAQAPRRTTRVCAALPSLGATLRRAAASLMAAAAPRDAAPWRDPAHFTAERWWSADTVAVVRCVLRGQPASAQCPLLPRLRLAADCCWHRSRAPTRASEPRLRARWRRRA